MTLDVDTSLFGGEGISIFAISKYNIIFVLKVTVFWDVLPYSVVEIYRRFRDVY
jgi:hypothetical protein